MKNREVLIWETAKSTFGLDSFPYKKIGSFESEVWEVQKQGNPFILRITDPTHRSIENLKAEASWIQYLADHKVEVVLPLKTLKDEYVSVSHDPNCFLMLFSKAKGRLPTLEDITDDFIFYWGSVMGKMHRVASSFQPSIDFARSNITDSFKKSWDKVSDRVNPEIANQVINLMETISLYHRNRDNYGVIHYDLHMRNFFVNEGRMTIFDFDDMQFGWFAYDIAISLYYWLWMVEIMKPELQNDDNRRKNISIHFLQNFITGYQTEYHFSKEWLDMMPVFVAIRQMELYLIFEERFGHITDLNSKLYLQTAQFKKNVLEKKQVVPFGVFARKHYSLLI